MRVLIVNKFWFMSGGVERVMFDEIAWLEEAGHSTAHFSTIDSRNRPSPWEQYFVPYVDISAPQSLSIAQKARASVAMFSNPEAARRFGRVCDEFIIAQTPT